MFYQTDKNDHGLPHDPFKAIVAPRPIGWITSMSAKGEINLAPYSYFNGVHSRPPMVMFASEGRKDSLAWVRLRSEARASPASMGICPDRFRCQPRNGYRKSSFFAMKCSSRGIAHPTSGGSRYETWLAATISGPLIVPTMTIVEEAPIIEPKFPAPKPSLRKLLPTRRWLYSIRWKQ